MSRAAHIVFLLHMHQPDYVDPRVGYARLPWVRLHGARGYLDVATLLADYPRMRLTVNFVPSLVAQLEDVVAGARDEWLRVCEQPSWSPEERVFLVERLFSLNWGRSVEPRPRYRELLDKRGRSASAAEVHARAATFDDGELRDLTVLFHLAWLGFAARNLDGGHQLGELERKGRGYTRADLDYVVERQRAACARVLPLYRELSARGQVELSASPYYHPIVPLLIDSEHARRAQPHATLPPRFTHPEDASAHIERGREAHAQSFGVAPAGMWPPEGAISPEAVARYGRAGIGWLASDEGNLWRSLLAAGIEHGRGDLYRAWRHGDVDLVFRDRELSDKIGFAYAHGDAHAGVEDLVAHAEGCARASSAPHGEPALVPIFLDGENPWESYPEHGEPFLRALFARLSAHPSLTPASVGQYLQAAPSRRPLAGLHSGSWIDSDFHIWIGDPVKNRAWELLGATRARLERARADGAPAEHCEAAYRHLLAAEGSDWFWWFGEPFHSAEDALFDALFRAHLAGAHAALGLLPPATLDQPVSTSVDAVEARTLTPPFALIHPRLGGRGFYQWHGAGRYRVARGAAMADTPLVNSVVYGFDRHRLYLRLEPSDGRAEELAAADVTLELRVGARRLRLDAIGDDWVLRVRDGAGEGNGHDGNGGWREQARGGPVARARTVELGVPWSDLGVAPEETLGLVLQLGRGPTPLGRYPADGEIAISAPGAAFEAQNWSA